MQFIIFALLLLWLPLTSAKITSSSYIYSVTAVSGYWAGSNFSDVLLSNTLSLNAPMIFIYETLEMRKQVEVFRLGYPTRYYDKGEHLSNSVPGTKINWVEKIYIMQRAAEWNPFQTEWFLWLEGSNPDYTTAKVSTLRWPDPTKLTALPPKVVYAETNSRSSFDVTAFMWHSKIIPEIIGKLNQSYLLHHEQSVFALVKSRNGNLFHRIGKGEGSLLKLLGFSMFTRAPSIPLNLETLLSAPTSGKNSVHLASYAIVTMISSDDYIRSANVLYYSLIANLDPQIRLRTKFIALLIQEHKNKRVLKEVQGWSTVSVPLLKPPYDGAVTFDRFKEQFTKLHIWRFTAFDRVLYLDSDTLCVNNPSSILTEPITSFAAVYDWEQGQIRTHFNMGVFSIKPNAREFDRLNNLRYSINIYFEK